MPGQATRGYVDASALRGHVAPLFAPTRRESASLRTGVEVELLCVEGRPPRPVPAMRTHAALLRHDTALLREGRVTFEPGGQLELSPPPCDSPAALLALLDSLLARVDAALAGEGMVAVAAGMNPWHDADSVGMHLEAPRYQVMQRHFDSLGGAGRDMMRLTAGLQVCVDLCPGDQGVEQWLLANRMGPALTAAFAHSGVVAGAVSGASSTRCQAWQRLDASRTGFDGAQVSAQDAVAAYTAFAAEATPMPLPRSDVDDDSRPDDIDLRHHLSTLFPPVRPRGYLEVRYLDMPPRACLDLPLPAVDLLLRDATARAAALRALDDVDRGTWLEMWEAAAHQGVVNPWLRHEALLLLGIAAEAAARRSATDEVPRDCAARLRDFRDAYTCRARTWSDDQVQRHHGPHREDPTAWT